MSWFLRVQEGNSFRDVAALVDGQSLIVGRADSADLAFPDDFEMSSRHASITLRNGICFFSDLHSTNGTFLDEEPAADGELSPGAQLRCGGTVFCVESAKSQPSTKKPLVTPPKAVTDTSVSVKVSAAPTESPLPPDVQLTAGFVAPTAVEVVKRFGLDEMLPVPPSDGESPQDYSSRLISAGEDNDCLNFLAYALPKRLGVWWAIQCLQSEDGLTGPDDEAIIEAVEAWVGAPSDATRRQAMQLAEATGMKTAAAWAAVAAFWSHGSMAPEGQPDVPAKDEMAGKGLSGSVILASVVKTPELAPERRKTFVGIAHKIATGELPPPDGKG